MTSAIALDHEVHLSIGHGHEVCFGFNALPELQPEGDRRNMVPQGDISTVKSPGDLALAIEPDLRLLEGIAILLRHLGQGTDPIEPGGIPALAISAQEPISRMIALRRAATLAGRDRSDIVRKA